MTIFGEGSYCCLCFGWLEPEDASLNDHGELEDVCHACKQQEREYLANHQLTYPQ